jgi:carboxyl-terminal processing protease
MENKPTKGVYLYLPIIIASVLIVGIFLGSKLAPPSNHTIIFPSRPFSDINKVNEVLNYVEDTYVDEVNKSELVETSIEKMLQNLDPHSYYIRPADLQNVNAPLEGNFDGIGIEFRILRDTLVVISPIKNGPSHKAGVQAGDRIIAVNDSSITDGKISNDSIMTVLKGKAGTEVKISVKRKGNEEPLQFVIKRGKIPIQSIDAAYMLDKNAGYIKISRFGKTTYQEFMESSGQLLKRGLKHLVLDLRNNGGGYLKAATQIADELLSNKELIVYTEGHARPRQSFYASDKGLLQGIAVHVLINENTASASEILAGAIQGNDRGEIVGRRSFGKGLVQEQLELPDGSAVRLTVARYFTPTGRSIQKPYGKGIVEYQAEVRKRLKNGELYEIDSIRFTDSLKFITKGGKVVYGGGGIMPDLFVPLDTSYFHNLSTVFASRGVFQEYGFYYADEHRQQLLESYGAVQSFEKGFLVSHVMHLELAKQAKEAGLLFTPKEYNKAKTQMELQIKAAIAQNFWGSEGYLYITNQADDMILKTMAQINEGK